MNSTRKRYFHVCDYEPTDHKFATILITIVLRVNIIFMKEIIENQIYYLTFTAGPEQINYHNSPKLLYDSSIQSFI